MVADEGRVRGLKSGFRIRAVWRGVLGAWGRVLRGFPRGLPISGATYPTQGLHISRETGTSYPGAIPGGTTYLGADLCLRGSILSRGHLSYMCPGHPFEAVYRAQGMHKWPVQGPPIPMGNPEHPITGLPIPWVHDPSPRAAFLHTNCSQLSGSRCGTLGGWRHLTDLGSS